MMIQVSDSNAVDGLSDFLQTRMNAIVEQTTPHGLEISLLGSFNNSAMAKEIGAALREWRTAGLAFGCRVELNP